MNKRWLRYVSAMLLCCGALAFYAFATQNNDVKTVLTPAQDKNLAASKQVLVDQGRADDFLAKRDEVRKSSRVSSKSVQKLEGVSTSTATGGSLQQEIRAAFEEESLGAAPEKVQYHALLDRLNAGYTLTETEKHLFYELDAIFSHETRESGSLDDTGGGDGFGYYYVDNLNADTATFAWVELCGDPNAIEVLTGDDTQHQITWNWSFPFYGASYSTGFINSNGQLRFVTGATTLTNADISPTNTTPWISGFWDDLDADGGGPAGTGCAGAGDNEVYWRDFGDRVVISWTNTPHWSESTDRYNFQIIIYPSGKIKLQYNTNWVNGTTGSGSASIHIDGPLTDGVSYLYNNVPATHAITTGGRAVWFYQDATATGRCCYFDGNATQCLDAQTSEDCAALGGNWALGETCASAPCAVGRCCYGDPCAPTCDDDMLVEDCNALSGTFSLGLDCTTPCPTAAAGDLICNAIVIPALPYTNDGTTVGFTNNYDEVCPFTGSTSPDVVYSYTPGANQTVDATLCGGITAYDTKMYVYENVHTPGAPFACNDDACNNDPIYTSNFISQLLGLSLTGGNTYYFVVDGYGSSSGAYTLSISIPTIGACCYGENLCCVETSETACTALGGTWTAGNCTSNPCTPVCTVTCGANDVIEVTEPDPDITPDSDPTGGCNNTVPAYQDIACGDTVCGVTFYYGAGSFRDTDWFRFTIPGPDPMNVEFGGIGDYNGFQALLIDLNADCAGSFVISSAGVFEGACGTNYSTSLVCLDPGTYVLFASINAGEFTCPSYASPGSYRVWVNCSPCTPPVGRCCYDGGASCADNTEAECALLGGSWDGLLTCATACPVLPPNDDCGTAEVVVIPENGSVSVAVDNNAANTTCADTCDFDSNGPDVFYTFTLTDCRRIAIVATDAFGDFPDSHISLNLSANCCVDPQIWCDDDWANFDVSGLAWWDPAIDPVGCGLCSRIGGLLDPGTYTVRAGHWSTSWQGAYQLTFYDFGPCVEAPCDPVADLTIALDFVGNQPNNYKLNFTAPQDEDYTVWYSTIPNNDGDPDGGTDPDFVIETVLLGQVAGPVTYTAPAGFDNYRYFVVTAGCQPFVEPVGRCCYDNNTACADVTQAECDGLSGTWNNFLSCADPCPDPLPTGRCCYDGGLSCNDLLEADCILLGGAWDELLNCTDNPCGLAPANDDCGNAIAVLNGVPMSGTTIDAALGTDITSCVLDDLYDVWYVYNVTTLSAITVGLCDAGSDYDTGISLWDACGGTQLACDDDACVTPSLASQVIYTPTVTGNIYIRVSGFNSQTGNFVLSVVQ
ncbi:MAG: hypothetical protein H6508_00945 [Calditrichaeota bacterium]|nr:hypothetical protein [Calditrichota bacterium]MCB9365742.1 hypothetical protein [Calditrichota bacterium]